MRHASLDANRKEPSHLSIIIISRTKITQLLLSSIKSSLSKSMQLSIPPIGRRWTFSTSQVDLTHNDDYVVTIVNIINFTTIVFTSMQ